MENQYCKVGDTHPLHTDAQGLHLLENQLRNFQRKAAEATQSDSGLKDFFEQKAQKIQKLLKQFV